MSARNTPNPQNSGRPIPEALLHAAISLAAAIIPVIAAVANWLPGALRDAAGGLISSALIHLAAEPYTDAEIHDPFFDSGHYELAREVQAIERLLRGRLASRIGVCRMMRLLGGAEPVPAIGCLTAAERETVTGDLVFLTFEYAASPEQAEPVEPGLIVAVYRTSAGYPRRLDDLVGAPDSTFALIEFYSDRSPRQKRA